MQNHRHKAIFSIIFTVCLVVPFSIDIFISGLPEIGQHFPGANISLLLSVALFGFALAQPFYGPLLDRFGRRPVLLAGLWIYTLASAQVMLANSFELLIIGRFIQTLGACSATISIYAIARDSYTEERLLRVMSSIMALMGISPAIAPLLGSLLNAEWGWRASFIFLFVMGCFFTVFVQFFFKETLTNKNREALTVKNIIMTYANLARNSKFLMYCVISGFSYSVLFSYFNLSPLFIIEQMHFSLISYGIIVAMNALAIVATTILIPMLAKKFSLLHIMRAGLMVILIGGVFMGLINVYLKPNLYTFMLPMGLTTTGIGMIRGTASASAMQLAAKQIAGSAAAFFNFITFVSGAFATIVTARLIHQIPGFGLFISLMALAGLGMMLLNKGRKPIASSAIEPGGE